MCGVCVVFSVWCGVVWCQVWCGVVSGVADGVWLTTKAALTNSSLCYSHPIHLTQTHTQHASTKTQEPGCVCVWAAPCCCPL